jgi:quercetin dioxygenase-like cupin family protein
MKSQPETARAGGVIDLVAVARELRADAIASAVKHAARTILREPDLRVVVIAMEAGARLAEHHASNTASLQVLHGLVRLHSNDRVVDLHADQLLPIECGLAHEVEALAESAFVLVLGRSAP